MCTSDGIKSFKVILSKPNLNEIRRTKIYVIISELYQASQISTKVRKSQEVLLPVKDVNIFAGRAD